MDDLSATRRALHGVAELVMAGPQYRLSGTIRLRVAPGGFRTVASPDLSVEGATLVAGDLRIPLAGTSFAEVARRAGVDVGAPEGLYHDGSGATPADGVHVDPEAAGHLAECLASGDAALRTLAPDAGPVLWPEHFDLGITLDEVNYGISLGDGHIAEPYAYVGPWKARSGGFWNVSFGAARTLAELAGVEAIAGFFGEGRRHATADPT